MIEMFRSLFFKNKEEDKAKKIGNVLSLFDGMSCGQIALNRLGIEYGNFYSSEVDKHAIKVTQHNYPNTIQIGDVTQVRAENLPQIDLLIGGSPCQGFSFSGKGLNFEDPRSKLFFEFVRLLKETKPRYFLLENVKMKKEYEQVITDYLGVEPIEINSSLVSAQNRVRLYWTNIPNIQQPEDRGISLVDILEEDDKINPGAIRGRQLNKATILGRRLNAEGKREDYNMDIPITQCLEVRATNTNKSNCLTTVAKDNVLTTMPIGRHTDAFKNGLPFRYYTSKEYCRLQTVPDNYFDGVASENQIRKMIGNGWTVDVIAHIFKNMESL
jgi:site-specific DNA-cytosine methylase